MRIRTASALGAGALLVAAGLAVHASPFHNPEDRDRRIRDYRCDHRTVEVALRVDLGRQRPVEIEYKLPGDPPVKHRINADTWVTVDEAFECPGTARVTVHARDAFGGNTSCWIEVDGRKVIGQSTRKRETCSVTAQLVAP